MHQHWEDDYMDSGHPSQVKISGGYHLPYSVITTRVNDETPFFFVKDWNSDSIPPFHQLRQMSNDPSFQYLGQYLLSFIGYFTSYNNIHEWFYWSGNHLEWYHFDPYIQSTWLVIWLNRTPVCLCSIPMFDWAAFIAFLIGVMCTKMYV